MNPAFGPEAGDSEEEASKTLPVDVSDEELDTVFEILIEERRQFTLQYLVDEDGTVSLTELVTHLVERESTVDRTNVATDLHHSHLPKLEAKGLVEYDHEANTVAATPAGRETAPVVELFVQSAE